MSKKKKVLGIIRLYCGESGKLEYYNLQELGLAKEYVKNGYTVYIIILKKGNKKNEYKKINKKIYLIYPITLHIFNHGIFSVSIIRKLKLNLIHLNSDNQLLVPIVLCYCQKHGIEIYNYVGMLFPHNQNKIKKMLANLVAKNNIFFYKRFLTIAKTGLISEELSNRNVKNIPIVPVGLDVDDIPHEYISKQELKKNLNIPLDKKIILFIGRMQEEKNPIEALKLLRSLDKKYIMVMIGDGRLSGFVEKEIKCMSLEDRVYRILEVKNSEIYKYYRCADCYINLTKNEIFGMCILEAMYNRCIVIAFKAPGPCMIINNGGNGFLVNNIKEIKFLLENNINGLEIIRQRAYEVVCNNYLWEHSYKQIQNIRKNFKLL